MSLELLPLRNRGLSDSVTKIQIALMGDKNVGKTSIVRRYVQKVFRDTDKGNVKQETYQKRVGGFLLEILDVSADAFNPSKHTGSSLPNCDAFILVYSVDDMTSFDVITALREIILSARGEMVPIIVVGNKSELTIRKVHSVLADCVVSIDWEHPYYEVSAKSNHNITQIFKQLMENPQFRRISEASTKTLKYYPERRRSSLTASLRTCHRRSMMRKESIVEEENIEPIASEVIPKAGMKSRILNFFHGKCKT